MKRKFWIALLSMCIGVQAKGQTSITMLANPTINVQSATDRQTGVTISQQTLDITARLGLITTLQVRASSNLSSGLNSIPLSSLFLQVTAPTSLSGSEIQLSTANQTLFSTLLNITTTKQPVTIKYRLASGASLFQPAGAYTTTLTFTLSQL